MVNKELRNKLLNDPDGFVSWGNEELPWGGYDTEEITALQMVLMLYGFDDVYVILILPGDDGYDVWLRYKENDEMVRVCRGKTVEDAILQLWGEFPYYVGLV